LTWLLRLRLKGGDCWLGRMIAYLDEFLTCTLFCFTLSLIAFSPMFS